MDTASVFIGSYFGWFIDFFVLVLLIVFYKRVLRLLGIYIVPDDSIGTVVKKFVLFGEHRQLPPGKIVALRGEAGIQAATLAPGLYMGLWPWQYEINIVPQLVIPTGEVGVVESCDGRVLPDGRILGRQVACDDFQDAVAFLEGHGERGAQMALIPPGTWRINPLVFKVSTVAMTVIGAGKIGIVEARDGRPLAEGRVIGRQVDCDSFQDARAFIDGGGERGPQMAIVPQGTYRINPMLFKIELADVTDVPEGRIGIVTTREGRPLATGEIAGPEVPGHNLFQDPQRFVDNGGNKGLQEQVLLSGRYFINPKFAVVEMVEQTNVPIANVGVVVAYVGREGRDVTGEDFRHGNLVARGEKGVWVEPLDPGMYPINPHTHKVKIVPTANVVLNWATGRTEAHNLDAKLCTIKVRSSDGFSYNLDVSQIIHIPRNDAPRVIARFGSMDALVTQVLEPTIGNYFRNAAQKSDVIDFLSSRSERQAQAKAAIAAALAQYNVGAVETLIGDINPPEELMKPLTDRKVAETQKATFVTQQQAQTERQKLEQAKALADTQPQVVAAERKVAIARFDAEASVHAAEGMARSKTINADADARVTRVNGEAEATVIRQVGEAEAVVVQLKTNAVGAGNYASIQVAEAFGRAGLKLVPEVMVAGGGSSGGTLVDALLGSMLASKATGTNTSGNMP
ncbi:SPFH domain-containing protein [Paucibacter sp. R3-3]|uniref:SPFH domain-containing protein n=1 Tax=Roseateles agri TaxID=3098619 RepID=A0ABU5DGR5_9BURK|nr:SPFH domain-containing protein [Paucibacter sp. R3-3]MDY0745478.1 SPFH domain-containing protein [Paucibacter sp. R3-3]